MTRNMTSFGAAFLAAMILASATRAVAADDATKTFAECAKACSDCQRECASCFNQCVGHLAKGHKAHAAIARLCADCDKCCALAGQPVRRQQPARRPHICVSCAKCCDDCAAACEKSEDDKSDGRMRQVVPRLRQVVPWDGEARRQQVKPRAAPGGSVMIEIVIGSGAALALAVLYLASCIRVLNEYERGVIFRLGRAMPAPKGPGLILVFWPVDSMVRVDLRTITTVIEPQDVITRDNVSVRVNAVLYFRVVDPMRSVLEVADFMFATSQVALTTLRSTLGQAELDDLLTERDKVNRRLQEIIDGHTEPWGVKVSVVEVKDVDLPEPMKRSMAHQAEAERDRRAKVINAEGEFQAADKLRKAAEIMTPYPMAMQMRYLQTLTEVALGEEFHHHLPAAPRAAAALPRGRPRGRGRAGRCAAPSQAGNGAGGDPCGKERPALKPTKRRTGSCLS